VFGYAHSLSLASIHQALPQAARPGPHERGDRFYGRPAIGAAHYPDQRCVHPVKGCARHQTDHDQRPRF